MKTLKHEISMCIGSILVCGVVLSVLAIVANLINHHRFTEDDLKSMGWLLPVWVASVAAGVISFLAFSIRAAFFSDER